MNEQLSSVTQELFKICVSENDGTPPLQAYEMLVQKDAISQDSRQVAALKPLTEFYQHAINQGEIKQPPVDNSNWTRNVSNIFGGLKNLFQSDVELNALGEPLRDFYGTVIKKRTNSAVADDVDFESRSIWLPGQQGVYLHGGVGCGKTLIMDLMFFTFPRPWKRRVHFHAFMLDVHQRLHERCISLRQLGQDAVDPLPEIAQEIFEESKLLCFDEFQVTDVADAMVSSKHS
jgi:predicted ATPase